MALTFERVAVVGATGPTGRTFIRELEARGIPARAIARDAGRLAAAFPYDLIERRVGDARNPASLIGALQGCDAIIDCMGISAGKVDDYVETARNLGQAMRVHKARLLMVSNYWSYMPIRALPVSEARLREGGSRSVRLRREAEDILAGSGAAVVHLPDFFGPHVHTGTLQLPLADAVADRPMRWIGPAAVARDYVFVPDAMRIAAELMVRDEAYGNNWIIPGCGPISGYKVAETVAHLLGRPVRLRPVGRPRLWLAGVFDRELRRFLPVASDYVKQISFNGGKLDRLIGPSPRTPYPDALRQTLRWIRQG